MPGKVFIEQHLDNYLKSLVKGQFYTPGVIIGQVIGDNYYIVHLSAITTWNEDTANNMEILAYKTLNDLLANSDMIFQKALDVVNLLPGGSHVLGLFFIIPQDIKSVQPINIDFHEFNNQLNDHLSYKKKQTWNYLLLNYSTINKKSFCYKVDFNHLNGPEQTTYKSIDEVFQTVDDDWVTLIGTFNFKKLDQLCVAGGQKTLFSIREDLLDKYESILNKSLFTFNGCVYDENKTLKDLKCNPVYNSLKNVVNIEFFREIDLGNDCKNASLKVERGKGKVFMSGICGIAVPFNRNGTFKDAIKAIHGDAMKTFATRLKMHLESLIEEESVEEEEYGDTNVVHETPRRILIIKTEGSRFAFSDYVFPGEAPQEALNIAGEVLNLPKEKMELYSELERGDPDYHYGKIPVISSSPPPDTIVAASTVTTLSLYSLWAALILGFIAIILKFIELYSY